MKLKTIRTVLSHPLNADRPFEALFRFLKRGVMVRLHRFPIVYPFIENTFLVVERGMFSAELQVYTYLYDFREMFFLLHYMREGEDVFVDVGANVGVYTVLAAGGAKVRSVAVEPVPETFRRLERNVAFNGLNDLTELHNVGAGDRKGHLNFTTNLDAVNHVVRETGAANTPSMSIPVMTLDDLLANTDVTCLKIDVEGFEANVVNGASSVLERAALQVVIMETNGLSDQYAFSQSYLHDQLVSFGFHPCRYDPVTRGIIRLERPDEANTIYIKDVDWAMHRVEGGRRFKIADRSF